MAQHFDLAALERFVDGAFGARAYQAFDLHAKLVAQVFGDSELRGTVGVAHDLHVALSITQVDEDDAAVVAPAIDPTAKADGLTQLGLGHETAIFRTHEHGDFRRPEGASFLVYCLIATVEGPPGTTTPIDTMYLSASSTLIFNSMQSLRLSITK